MNAKQNKKLNVENNVSQLEEKELNSLEDLENQELEGFTEEERLEDQEEDTLTIDEENDIDVNDTKYAKEIKKFNANYRRSYKQSLANEAALKLVDAQFLKKIKIKRNEIITSRKKIDANNAELEKAYNTFKEIYYSNVNDEMILDTKDKALAQKTLLYRKNVRDIDTKLEKQEKEYKELLKDKEEALAQYKKGFTQTIMDLDRKKKGEIQKGKKAKADENARLNEMLSETNDRIRINAINERLNFIKKESLEGSKEINIKYTSLRKEEDIKNITYLMENEKAMLDIHHEYEKSKNELEIQKKQAELDYEIESKTYILAAKRADNNLKKDIVIKKNGVLVSIYDENQSLYNKIANASIDLLNLQEQYNKVVLDKILKENIDRTNLVLSKIKYVASSLNEDMNVFFDKASPSFIQSLIYTNALINKNLIKAVRVEIDKTIEYVQNTYEANARALNKYDNISSKVEESINKYKKECSDLIHSLYNLKSKENKDLIRFIPSLDDTLKNIAKERNDLYKKMMDEINHTVMSFASTQNEVIQKFKNDTEVISQLNEEKAKFFIGEYKTAEEEMKAIEVIHSQNDKQIDLDINQFNMDIENKKKQLAALIENKEIEFANKKKEKLEQIDAKYKADCENIEIAFKESMKTISGDYKTENKLL